MSHETYFVAHETRYRYSAPVGLSRQMVHLTPREVPWQRCHAHALTVTPTPEVLGTLVDSFGNPVTSLCLESDHASLTLRAESWVTVEARTWPADDATMPWDQARARLAYEVSRRPSPEDLVATRFAFESSRVRNKRELAAWALPCFPEGAPLLACVRALMAQMQRELVFDKTATTVSTPVMEVFERRRGVCQDYAHLMLSCLRSLGLSARYVSGYLLTSPPPGKPRLLGADASHAWVSVYCPGDGWIDVDPTNGVFVGLDHVTLAWGRDYDDVIPIRGVILGGGEQTIAIEVTVVPLAEYEALFGALPPVLSEEPAVVSR